MVRNKTSHFAFDWWIIQKRFVYLVIAIFMLCGLAAGAAVYVWKYGNPFRNVAQMKNTAGARFISFEGDVKVVRAATRETVFASSETELYPGDTGQRPSAYQPRGWFDASGEAQQHDHRPG
jgi:hypothetical protein